MKKSKHLKILARRVEQATSEATAEEQKRQIAIQRTTDRHRKEQQQSDDIALIEAGMIPLRVFSAAIIPGTDQTETIFDNGGPVETQVSFTVHGADPALLAALRAISTRDR